MTRKNPTVQLTVKMKQSDYDALRKLSIKTQQPMSQLVRQFIAQGMSLEKTKDDIDFIRKQIREELEIALEKRMSRIIKLLIKNGSMIYPMAYYSTMLTAIVSKSQGVNYRDLLEDAKKEGARYLDVDSESIDRAFEEMMRFKV